MKKNKTMRIASVLLIAVLLTTSIISGTFAKYVTTGSASDSARVAKFGVVVSASGELFDENYYTVKSGKSNQPAGTAADEYDNTLTVESSSTGEKVVAPGTKSDEANPFSLKLSGTPEVDVEITIAIGDDYKDVWLQEGWFADVTGFSAEGAFYNSAVYYPVVYTLKKGNETLVSGTLADIKTFLDGYKLYVDANTNLNQNDYVFTLSWEWKFEETSATADAAAKLLVDQKDTLLGYIAAERVGTSCQVGAATLVEGGQYNVDTNVTLSVTVTQVD